MQHSAIYDPRAVETPSQAEAAKAHRERLEKMQARALKPAQPLSAPTIAPAEPEAPPALSFTAWVERQERLNPLPKAPWFAIEAEIDPPEPAFPRIETIQHAVAKHYGVTRNDLICARRTRPYIIPRHVGMYLCRSLTMKSFPEIGRRFGRRDHTVPLYACRKIELLIKTDPQIAADVAAIQAQLVVA